MLHQTML